MHHIQYFGIIHFSWNSQINHKLLQVGDIIIISFSLLESKEGEDAEFSIQRPYGEKGKQCDLLSISISANKWRFKTRNYNTTEDG